MTDQTKAGSTDVCAIITTFNYERFIADAIDSVLTQSLPPDEIVVVDDGSTDRTAEVVSGYADRGVRYVFQENSGAGAARNRGLRETTGALVAYLDADDIWLPDKLKKQVSCLASRPDAVMVTGQKIWWDTRRNTRVVESIHELSPAAQRRDICIDNTIGNPSMALIRRGALDQVGHFDESLRWGQDWELFIRLASEGPICVVPDPVIVYRWHTGGLSHENRQERLSVIHSISRRAISRYEPVWYRPVLRMRAWSSIEFDRARLGLKRRDSRARQLWHASRALASFPLSRGLEKSKLVFRLMVGERAYTRVRDRRGKGDEGTEYWAID